MLAQIVEEAVRCVGLILKAEVRLFSFFYRCLVSGVSSFAWMTCSWSYSAQPTFWVIQQPDEADSKHDPGRFYLQRL